jgi:hypothetical protein
MSGFHNLHPPWANRHIPPTDPSLAGPSSHVATDVLVFKHVRKLKYARLIANSSRMSEPLRKSEEEVCWYSGAALGVWIGSSWRRDVEMRER